MKITDWIFNRHQPSTEVADATGLFPAMATVRISVANILDWLDLDDEIHLTREETRRVLTDISELLVRSYPIEGLIIASHHEPFPSVSGFDSECELIKCVQASGVDQEQAKKFIKVLLGNLSRALEAMNETKSAVAIDTLGFWRLGDKGTAYFTENSLGDLPKDRGEW